MASAALVGVLVLLWWSPWSADAGSEGALDREGGAPADVVTEVAQPPTSVAQPAGASAPESDTIDTPASPGAPATPAASQRTPTQVFDKVVFEVTCAGAPLRDAHVVVAPVLRDPMWEGSNEAHSYEREQFAAVFVSFETTAVLRTDESGRCVYSLSALIEIGRPLVVGVLHEAAFGDVLELDLAALANSPVVAIELDPAPPCTALVRGSESNAEVVVQQSALYMDFREVDDFTNVFVSRPLLRFTHTRRGDGSVTLFPVRGRNWVTGVSGALLSAPYIGPLDGDIDVELGASFTVEGAVEGHPARVLEGVARVQALDRATGEWLDRGFGAIAMDGTIAPIAVAWTDTAAAWRVRADAVDLLPLEEEFFPSPAGRFHVALQAYVQVFYDVRVFDAISRDPVPGARVVVDWLDRKEPPWEELTNESGLVKFNHLPAGEPWTFSIDREGYAPSGSIELSADVAPINRVLHVSLWPETVVVGEVVPAFDGVESWRGEMKRFEPVRSSPLAVEVDAIGGVFELRGLGGQRLSLFLESERGTIGPIDFAAAPGRVDLGRLEVVPFTTAEVRVLDSVSGEPIVGASIAPRAPLADRTAAAQSEVANTDDRGFARLMRFSSAGGWLSIEAPWYSSSLVSEFEWRDGIADFGDVLLAPDRRVVVELGERVATPQRFSIGQVNAPRTRVRFDAAGRAVLATAADAWHLELVDHQGRAERLRLLGSVDALGARYEWPMRAGTLEVEIRNWPELEEGAVPYFHSLELAWREPIGTFERFLSVSSVEPPFPARALPVNSVRFSLKLPRGEVLAWGRAELPPVGDQKIVIDASVGATAILVVDGNDQPLAHMLVVAFDRSETKRFNVVGTTDTDGNGLARVPLLESGELGITLIGPNDEIEQDVDTRAWRSGATHDIVFAPSGVMELLVTARAGDASATVASAEIELRRGDDTFRLIGFETDGGGRSPRLPVQPGTYLAVVSKAGHWSCKRPIDIAVGGSSPIEVLLPELARLEVKLVDASGAALVNSPVELLHEGLDEFHSEWLAAGRVSGAAVTDLAGRIVLDGVPAGTYLVGVGGFEVGTAATGVGVTTVVVR